MAGGIKVVAIYARLLSDRGHTVNLVSPPAKPVSLREKFRALRRGEGWPRSSRHEKSHLDGSDLKHRVLDTWRPVVDSDVPDADVVIATWWETAEWVHALSRDKGAKVHFVQGHETFPFLPKVRVQAAYRLPLHKVTISHWLVELLRDEYGASVIDRVPNSVDHTHFHASPRGKQARPTVGLLYSRSPFKGIDASVAALTRVKQVYPDLRLLSFGAEDPFPGVALPNYAEFHKLPERETLRDLYASCDVWLCGSRSEGFHLPPVEAMACRTPVVSTRVGGPMDLIQPGINGELVEIDDIDGLANATIRLLGLPDSVWREASENAYRTVADYTWEHATERFLATLEHARGRAANGEI
jgi:glycosyltransferase involved in cell wall biosynthesis